jgi:hypothetical protein
MRERVGRCLAIEVRIAGTGSSAVDRRRRDLLARLEGEQQKRNRIRSKTRQ